MSGDCERDLRVIVHSSDAAEGVLESQIRLPNGAEFQDFIEALRAESPAVYEEVRRRVMRAAGRVLAFGRDDPLLVSIYEKSTEGGTLVFPADEDDLSALLTIDEAEHLN